MLSLCPPEMSPLIYHLLEGTSDSMVSTDETLEGRKLAQCHEGRWLTCGLTSTCLTAPGSDSVTWAHS